MRRQQLENAASVQVGCRQQTHDGLLLLLVDASFGRGSELFVS
jgi:hypothetical protein